jgi:hypothetical protein
LIQFLCIWAIEINYNTLFNPQFSQNTYNYYYLPYFEPLKRLAPQDSQQTIQSDGIFPAVPLNAHLHVNFFNKTVVFLSTVRLIWAKKGNTKLNPSKRSFNEISGSPHYQRWPH